MFFRAAIQYGVDWWLFAEWTGTMLASMFGIAAVWIALGRGDWLLRVVLAAVLIGAWVLVPAYDVCLAALVESVIIIGPLLVWRRIRGRWRESVPTDGAGLTHSLRRRYQFAVRDLLRLMVLGAALSALLTRVPAEVWRLWPAILSYGIGFGIAVLIGTWAALGRRLLWLRVALVCLVPYAIAAAAWLALWRRWSAASGDLTTLPRRRSWGLALGLATLCMVLLPAWAFTVLVPKAPIPAEEGPEPNAYRELVQAGKAVSNSPRGTLSVKAWAQATAPAVSEARLALQKPCRVPIAYGRPPEPEDSDYRVRYHYLRMVACALLDEGEVATAEGRRDDALRSYRDVLGLARHTSRGGLSNDVIVARASERDAMRAIYQLRDQLTSQQCHAWIRLVQEQERAAEPLADVIARSRAWNDRALGWDARLRLRFWEATGSCRGGYLLLERTWRFNLAARRLLACELAIHLYSLEQGRPPEKLEELVPEYLPAVPLDPFTDSPLIYRRGGDGYLLYSVGPDGADDGGAPPQPNHMLRDFESGDYRSAWVFQED